MFVGRRVTLLVVLNSLAPEKCGCNHRQLISSLSRIDILHVSSEITLKEYHKTSRMIIKHRLWLWPGAVRQQAITWANVGQVLGRPMASLGHTELSCGIFSIPIAPFVCWICLNLKFSSRLYNELAQLVGNLPHGRRGTVYSNSITTQLLLMSCAARSHGIRTNAIGLVLPQHYSLSTLKGHIFLRSLFV